jgi:3-oxoacyl-[acyl-carrier-protein] synthase-3
VFAVEPTQAEDDIEVRIVSLSEVLPGDPITNAELADRFGLHAAWLDAMTGNRSRHFCSPDSAPGVPKTTTELAVAAGEKALASAGLGPESIDFLVLATASPEHLMPATAALVADALGINEVPTLQLTSGCAGALQGLYTARGLLASGMGRGLVIGADSCQKMWPKQADLRTMKPAAVVNLALFGDGAGAAVVDADDDGPGLVLEQIFLRTCGMGRKPAQVVRWYGVDGAPMVDGPRGTQTRESMAEEDYKAIETHVPEMAEQILKELSARTGWDPAGVEHVLTPQLNGIMTEKIREHMGVSAASAVSCVAETGNNGNALPFVQLNRAMRRIESGVGVGGRVLVVTVESSKWVKAGMALRHSQGALAGSVS